MRAAIVVALGLTCACTPRPGCDLPPPEAVERPNLLWIVIDDVGIDQLAPYGVGTEPVPTPALDCLCERGVRFDRAWAAPVCSPARAGLLTGIQARRDGLGNYLNVGTDDWELPLARTTVAEAVRATGYDTAFVGKWHVSTYDSPSGLRHPLLQGFDTFLGTPGNLSHGSVTEGTLDFQRWEHVADGVPSERRGYVTSATVDDALDVIDTLPEPWLVVVSLHAPHAPLHSPPRRLLAEPVSDDADPATQYRAMLEAVDTELGRLLRQIDPAVLSRTQLWTMSDNGTPRHGILPPLEPNRSKGTLFEGGVRVPLIVTGSGVEAPGHRSDALVSLLDVAPSAVRVAGGTPLLDADGFSLVPHLSDPDLPGHDTLYADITRPDGRVDRAVRSDHLKVIRRGDDPIELWTLGDGLDEEPLTADGVPLVGALDLLATLEAWEHDLETP